MFSDTDFPIISGNNGHSVGFAKMYASNLQGGKINNTWLPTTGDFFEAQQTMQDGRVSPVTGSYGEISSQQGSTGGSTGPMDPAYLEKMRTPVMPMPSGLRESIWGQPKGAPQTPGQEGAQQAFGFTFPTPFGNDFEVAAGPSFEINKGQGALGRRSGEQLLRLQQGNPAMQNEQLNEELLRRGIMSRGVQLPPV